ncbi:nuclease [Agrobacterium tumefaciens]|uniref:nuclease n=1 Tax=Agrobacterium tumefaciens TaxID=358 RepID=UPI0021D39395|nr:nuclease [Agrobacterium tumefaciens]UXS05564.1 nuclease [Agrobacterium tumefaciens]
MHKPPLQLAFLVGFLLTSVAPAWAADLSRSEERARQGHTKTSDTNKPRPGKARHGNTPVVVSATYCEHMACEPVTLKIWSGDTFHMHRLGPHNERIKIANIDAANPVTRCKVEAGVGHDAKLQLMSILSNSTFHLARVSGEKDRSSSAFVTANGRDVGKSMMDRHYARPFEDPALPWC